MSVSHWQRSADPAQAIDCDLCIIGAGICGVSAALHAQRLGLRVEVLERHTLAAGASSRNAGFLMRGAADHYADAVRIYGRARAAMIWKWTEENLSGLRAEGIESLPTYRAVPSCLLALSEQQESELAHSLTLLIQDGFEAQWITNADDCVWQSGHIRAGLANPHDASVNPVELMRLLASKLDRPIRERQEVFEIVERTDHVQVRTTGLSVRAGRVLLATNAYAGLLSPQLAEVVTPRRGQMLALRPDHGQPPLRLDRSYYVNHGSEYLRQTRSPDPAHDGTIVVGGCRTYFAADEVGYDDATTEPVQRALEAFARRLLPGRWSVTARWAGTMGFSNTGLPLVMPVAGFGGSNGTPPEAGTDSGRVWFCGGFTGHGMSMAYRTAQHAVGAMLGTAPASGHPFELSAAMPPITMWRAGPAEHNGAHGSTSPAHQARPRARADDAHPCPPT